MLMSYPHAPMTANVVDRLSQSRCSEVIKSYAIMKHSNNDSELYRTSRVILELSCGS